MLLGKSELIKCYEIHLYNEKVGKDDFQGDF